MVYEKIESLCRAKGISIAKLEKDTGLGNATIRGWKDSEPYLGNAKKVADYFGIGLDELLKDDGGMKK